MCFHHVSASIDLNSVCMTPCNDQILVHDMVINMIIAMVMIAAIVVVFVAIFDCYRIYQHCCNPLVADCHNQEVCDAGNA